MTAKLVEHSLRTLLIISFLCHMDIRNIRFGASTSYLCGFLASKMNPTLQPCASSSKHWVTPKGHMKIVPVNTHAQDETAGIKPVRESGFVLNTNKNGRSSLLASRSRRRTELSDTRHLHCATRANI